ncbi:MAG TPA: nitrite reductase large subunit, partial [Candidatus Limnocylindria bacterium]|nr:nitrite reductase large subunit [Candidatus Limnocylindria bacterium]
GNGGIHVRATDLLTKVATEEEAMEWCFAFMQLYREHARYLERTAPWIERVGLDFVKDQLADEADRKAFAARFVHSQTFSQDDPWAERARGAQAHEYRPLSSTMAAE